MTTNSVLKGWHPKCEFIDDLVELPDTAHAIGAENDYSLYVAYQLPVVIDADTPTPTTVIPRTFEDSLIYENLLILAGVKGSATSAKINSLIENSLSPDDLREGLFDLLKSAEKAAFALDCLMIEAPNKLVPPNYINKGLNWLQDFLNSTASDVISDASHG